MDIGDQETGRGASRTAVHSEEGRQRLLGAEQGEAKLAGDRGAIITFAGQGQKVMSDTRPYCTGAIKVFACHYCEDLGRGCPWMARGGQTYPYGAWRMPRPEVRNHQRKPCRHSAGSLFTCMSAGMVQRADLARLCGSLFIEVAYPNVLRFSEA